MRNALPGTDRRHIVWFAALCAIVFSGSTGLSDRLHSGADTEVIASLPVANQEIRSQVAAHIALQNQSPEQLLIQAADTFALMRVSGEEKLGGLVEQTLLNEALNTKLPAKLMLADLYQYQHRFDEALALLISVEGQASERQAYWHLRANLHRIGGQIQAMANACARGLAIARRPWTVLCEAEVAALSGERERADALLNTLVAQYGGELHNDADLMVWAANLFERAGHYKRASRYLQKALLLAPGTYVVDRLIRFQLADGDIDGAERMLRWWKDSGLAPSAPWQLSAALISAARGDPTPASRLLASLESALTIQMQLKGSTAHWRELTRLAMVVAPTSTNTLEYARRNWHQQKEPIDAALLAQAASASHDQFSVKKLASELNALGMSGLHMHLTSRGWL